ncbi:hypothetical protein CBF90_02040 [Microbacterium sp. AISO3]|nr:hypothetical protein CBF90_17205 [Microbacterium sp. AISO3]OWP23530.1 hypothetical protein CBF90_02040 [Microbacterium sp. AISO3]
MHLASRALFGLAGVAAALYVTSVGVTLLDAEHPHPWLPNAWYWLVLGVLAVSLVGGALLELLAARKKPSPTPADTGPTADTPRTVGGQAQPARARISGANQRFGRVMTSRMIGGRYVYLVKWASNYKTIGYLAAGKRGGFDVYDTDEVYLTWVPTLEAAANLMDLTAE